jgi:hypothetical protein
LNYYNYFTEIEETFVRRRGRSLLLSPLDWTLMESWQERGVPLHLVLRSVEKVFDNADKQPNRKRSIKSLAYCKEEVEAQYAEWLEAQVGKSDETESDVVAVDDFAADEIVLHIAEGRRRLIEIAGEAPDSVLRETCLRGAARLEELDAIEGAERIEQSLEQIESMLDAALLECEDAIGIRVETENALAEYKNTMDPEAYQNTLRLMLLKKLRERAGVPRLSLFYL